MSSQTQRAADLRQLFAERIVVLDGAMGTMIQKHKLDEAAYRGERFKAWPRELKGCNDLLVITQPQIIADIHRQFVDAGADLISTNTFNANSTSMADYGLEASVYELNLTAAKLARQVADEEGARLGRKVFVAGALGPTNRTASISPDVNDPGFRAVTFDDLVATYGEATRALIEGGADAILIETIFDTLNAKAAIYAVRTTLDAAGIDLPIIISGTITDASGRTLSGQTVEAFWASVRHARPITISLNCALGVKQLRPYVEELSRLADTNVGVYPNAGLPNAFGEYDEAPADTASVLGDLAHHGHLNLVGGCCGTTPAHIRAIAERVRCEPVRKKKEHEPRHHERREVVRAAHRRGGQALQELAHPCGHDRETKTPHAAAHEIHTDEARNQPINVARAGLHHLDGRRARDVHATVRRPIPSSASVCGSGTFRSPQLLVQGGTSPQLLVHEPSCESGTVPNRNVTELMSGTLCKPVAKMKSTGPTRNGLCSPFARFPLPLAGSE